MKPKYLATILAILKTIDFEVITAVTNFGNIWKYLGYFLFQHLVTLFIHSLGIVQCD